MTIIRNPLKIIAVDPGLSKTGIVILLGQKLLYKELITLNKDEWGRLRQIHERIRKITEQFQPDYLAIENQYLGFNAGVAIKLSALRGIIMGAYWGYNIKGEIVLVSPLEAKSAMGVNTKLKRDESKLAVRKMVELMYPELKGEEEDIIDAISIALGGFNKIFLE
jgi:Holliday junction resolvasome RuvABC endonuclease subunit